MEENNKTEEAFKKGLALGLAVSVIVILIAVAALVIFPRNKVNSVSREDALNLQDEAFQKKLSVIQSYVNGCYLGEIDSDKIKDYVLKGLMAGTGDKYAAYYNPEEYKSVKDSDAGEFKGIGIKFGNDTDTYKIISQVYEGSPAEEAGIQVGDRIIEVNGEDVKGLDLEQVSASIKSHDTASLHLQRLSTGEELDVTCEVRDITVPTVSARMEGTIGYLAISEFDQVTPDQFKQKLDYVKEQGATSLILDLRNNPGGLVTAVRDVAGFFMPGKTVTTMRDINEEEADIVAPDGEAVGMDCVILVNGNSASASEILTGAMKDYSLATIVGTKTYGKGIVQNVIDLDDGSGIKITVAKYYLPNGDCIHEKGIEPDVVVENETGGEDLQLQKAIEILSNK